MRHVSVSPNRSQAPPLARKPHVEGEAAAVTRTPAAWAEGRVGAEFTVASVLAARMRCPSAQSRLAREPGTQGTWRLPRDQLASKGGKLQGLALRPGSFWSS